MENSDHHENILFRLVREGFGALNFWDRYGYNIALVMYVAQAPRNRGMNITARIVIEVCLVNAWPGQMCNVTIRQT